MGNALKTYEQPEIEIIEFDDRCDVVVASDGGDSPIETPEDNLDNSQP